MKNTLWIVPLCLVLVLTACGKQQAAPAQAPAMEQTDAVQAEPQDTPQDEAAALAALLDEIRDSVTIGTAGSSLRAIAAAAKLLDWASGCSLDAEELAEAYARWLPAMRSDLPLGFPEQLSAVDYSISLLTDSDSEQAMSLLADAGCADCGYPWDEHALAVTDLIMEAAGIR